MIIVLLSLVAIPATFLMWPQLTQKYRPGTCLQSESTSEVYLVESFGDNIKGRGPSVRIIKANNYTQHKAGDIISINDGDKKLKKIDCE